MRAISMPIATTRRRLSLSRAAVLLLIAGWLLLAGQWPLSLEGWGMLVVLSAVALDLGLGVLTGWIALLPSDRLDERQAATRDRAYRLAFRLIGAGVLVMVILAVFGSEALGNHNLQSLNGVPDAISPRHLAALLELLIATPTAIVAWLQNSEPDAESLSLQHWWSLALLPIIVVAWLLAGQLLPPQLVTIHGNNGSFSWAGGNCDHYSAEKRVAGGFAGTARLSAEVCWNGQVAFLFGDPRLPAPQGVADVGPMPSLPDLSSCLPLDADRDFAASSNSCSQQIGSDGITTITSRTTVYTLPGHLAPRMLTIRLVVTRDGRLLSLQ